jgi:hypothetical protein
MEPSRRNDPKNRAEVDLIAEFDLEFGQSDNWDDETVEEFERRWGAIQKAFRR